jgi:methylamine dehydrogenase heavy chain
MAALSALLLLAHTAAAQDPTLPPLPIEPTGVIETLPDRYPASWFLVHDATFFHMSDGKVYVMDVEAEAVPQQVQGTFNVALIGNVLESSKRSEIYATETFHSRGTRGDRMDVLTIWDKSTLSPLAEIVWPVPGRYMGMPQRYAMTLTDNERLLVAANLNPAASATVIDLDTREIASQVATPGCAFVYPTGKRGFSSLCADGRFMSTELARDGSLVKQTRTDAFFDSDKTPVFERPAIIGGIAYFPSFAGLVHPVDLRGKVASVGEAWNLVPEADREAGWRPGGIGLIDKDDLGRFYLLMHPEGGEGSHNSGGAEVWVYDPAKKSRVQRIALQEWGLSLAVGRGSQPRLLVTNPIDMSVELYDGLTGEFKRKITDFGQETPLMLHGTR